MQPIDAALILLPWWIGWAGLLIYIPTVALVSLLIARWSMWVMLRPLRKCPEEPWTERARLAFPARTTAFFNLLTLTGGAGVFSVLFHGPLSRVPEPVFLGLAVLAAFVPVLWVSVELEHRLGFRRTGVVEWARGCLAFWFVLYPHFLVVGVTAVLLPSEFNATSVVLLVFSAVLVWFCAEAHTIPLARALGALEPASERTLGVVERATERTGIRPQAVYEIPWGRVNAFAIPRRQTVAFTDGALRCLNEDQLTAVCAHEMAHLAEPAKVVRIRALSTFLLFPFATLKPVLQTFGPSGLLVIAVVVIACSRWFGRMSQAKEHEADRAAQGVEADAGVYASALEVLHRAALVPAVVGTRSGSHPDLYDRLLAAGVQPDYPRPARPPRLRSFMVSALVPILFAGAVATLWWTPIRAARTRRASDMTLHMALGLTGGALEMSRLGFRHSRRGDRPSGIILLQAACELNREDAYFAALLVTQLAAEDRLREAEAALKDAESRADQFGVDDRDEEWLDRADRAIELCRERLSSRTAPNASK